VLAARLHDRVRGTGTTFARSKACCSTAVPRPRPHCTTERRAMRRETAFKCTTSDSTTQSTYSSLSLSACVRACVGILHAHLLLVHAVVLTRVVQGPQLLRIGGQEYVADVEAPPYVEVPIYHRASDKPLDNAPPPKEKYSERPLCAIGYLTIHPAAWLTRPPCCRCCCRDDNGSRCFNCEQPGHSVAECPAVCARTLAPSLPLDPLTLRLSLATGNGSSVTDASTPTRFHSASPRGTRGRRPRSTRV
jgi:hypothetical protein